MAGERIRAVAPCRVDLAGGTADLHPLYLLMPKAATLNFAIDVLVEATLSRTNANKTSVIIEDQALDFSLSTLEDKPPAGGELIASIWQYFHHMTGQHFQISTHSHSPRGAGLAASSALCVALVKSFCKIIDRQLDGHDLVRLCLDLEARVLGTPAGYQDFIVALNGGMQLIKFQPGDYQANKLSGLSTEIAQRFSLIYTGKPHHSGLNNWEVYKAFIEKEPQVIEALSAIGSLAEDLAKVITKGDWKTVCSLIKQEWSLRRQLSPVVSTPVINELIDTVESTGGAGKVCGAGGGGCALIFHNGSEKIVASMKAVESKENLQVLPLSLNATGCVAR